MIRWLANWRERRRTKEEKQQWMDSFFWGLAQGAEEERRRKDYLAGYDEAVSFWIGLFNAYTIDLKQPIEKSKKHRDICVTKWITRENDEANT